MSAAALTWSSWSSFRESPPPKGRFSAAVVFAIVLHGVFIALLLALSLLERRFLVEHHPLKKTQVVTMRSISSKSWAESRSFNAPGVQAKHLPTPQEVKPRGQVVDVAQGNNKVSPDAKYLAESSNAVDKQTRARETSRLYERAMAKTTTTQKNQITQPSEVRPEHVRGNHGHGADDELAALAGGGAQETQRSSARADRHARLSQNGSSMQASNLLASTHSLGTPNLLSPWSGAGAAHAASEGRAGSDGEDAPSSPAALGSQAGAAPPDHLEAVDEGDGTFLNTREWKYAGFFNRVKQCVVAHWSPSSVLERRRAATSLLTRSTMLYVTLSDTGVIREVHVAKGSGDEALDQEAVAAFERSQPFPNPPQGLVEADGSIRFYFGFFIENSGRAQFRPFRMTH